MNLNGFCLRPIDDIHVTFVVKHLHVFEQFRVVKKHLHSGMEIATKAITATANSPLWVILTTVVYFALALLSCDTQKFKFFFFSVFHIHSQGRIDAIGLNNRI